MKNGVIIYLINIIKYNINYNAIKKGVKI